MLNPPSLSGEPSLGWRHEKSHTLMQGVAFFMFYVLVMAGTMQASD